MPYVPVTLREEYRMTVCAMELGELFPPIPSGYHTWDMEVK